MMCVLEQDLADQDEDSASIAELLTARLSEWQTGEPKPQG
ncbi:hypothetical protein Pph01_72130 [Planotetraspora phitsanulokensis]|uniref:Uncharacterized protein n=1 Tax=Planotetraspora phitsanulokensis TaxID=575192 RepID=A0A8J3UP70_9ACTN|nr:hypothetical protein Pph01_72130 [Planotetraspora phitsanulokensis]